jgi:catechol 2,3-dioxygenase-like lactoylglutathione lyase family enzyme
MADIHHIALRVSDCIASARFYERAFGTKEIRRIERAGQVRAVWLRAGDIVLMLELSLRGTGAASGSGHVLIFPTPDLVAAEERFKALGIEVSDRTASTLYVEDPDGHRSGVSTFRFDETAS